MRGNLNITMEFKVFLSARIRVYETLDECQFSALQCQDYSPNEWAVLTDFTIRPPRLCAKKTIGRSRVFLAQSTIFR
jgi:hypothetical protein